MAALAGQRILASQINGLAGLYAPKTSDQSIASSTTLVNDSQLFVPLAANTTYEFALRILYQGAATGTGDLKFTFSGPSGFSMQYGLDYAVTAGLGLALVYGTAASVPAAGTNGTSNPLPFFIEGFVTTASTAGNLNFQWSQNTNNPTATTVKVGSRLIAINTVYI